MGITPDRVFAALGVAGEDDINLDHLTTLTGVRSAIKNGEMTVEEAFPLAPAPGERPKDLGAALDKLATSTPHNAETDEIIEQNSTVAATVEQSTANAAPVDDKDAGAVVPPQAAPASEKPKVSRAPTAEERRKAILADLVRQGDEIAETGERALDEWIDGLNGDEQALLTPAQRSAWKQAAVRASS